MKVSRFVNGNIINNIEDYVLDPEIYVKSIKSARGRLNIEDSSRNRKNTHNTEIKSEEIIPVNKVQ